MTLDSFTLHKLIFQIKYDSAFELWDRAGSIARRLTAIWPKLAIKEGQPHQQILSGDGVQIQTGFSASSVTIASAKALEHRKVQQLKESFEIWRDVLDLKSLRRVSTLAVYVKEFASMKEANRYLLGLKLTTWPDSKVFDQPLDSDLNGIDVQYRFEDENSFSTLRVRAEKLKLEVDLDPYFVDEPHIERTRSRMVIDFDRGMLGSIDATNLRVDEWLKGFNHVSRRDIDKILKVHG